VSSADINTGVEGAGTVAIVVSEAVLFAVFGSSSDDFKVTVVFEEPAWFT